MTPLIKLLIAIVLPLALFSCGSPKVPSDNVTPGTGIPSIYPDYTGIILPPNIAPMNFEIKEQGDEYVSRVTGPDGKSITVKGKSVKWSGNDWHTLLEASKGGELNYEVYVKNEGVWKRYSFTNRVAEEEIDPYISYRLIEPSFQQYAAMTINQRNLTSFDEEIVFNNPAPCDERRGFCINCHVPQNQYLTQNSQFHIRKNKGGTVIMTGDSVKKVNLKTDSTLSAGVYPAWHPQLPLIAYSTNTTAQKFLPYDNQKVEVYDASSDLILYDPESNEITNISAEPDLLETFPGWHPDGKRLYYSAARYPEGVTPENLPDHYTEIRYDILSRAFDPSTRRFSLPDTVVDATRDSLSVLLPRISPDGKYLLYCKAPFGSFHIWHPQSDLFITDLATGEERELKAANSPDTDSYHSWSSNSRWIVFSSRRDDGSYTRPYITYIASDGSDSKAFVVPQEDPGYYGRLMKSYNVPEFFAAPFALTRPQLLEAVDNDAKPAKFKSL